MAHVNPPGMAHLQDPSVSTCSFIRHPALDKGQWWLLMTPEVGQEGDTPYWQLQVSETHIQNLDIVTSLQRTAETRQGLDSCHSLSSLSSQQILDSTCVDRSTGVSDHWLDRVSTPALTAGQTWASQISRCWWVQVSESLTETCFVSGFNFKITFSSCRILGGYLRYCWYSVAIVFSTQTYTKKIRNVP